MPVVDRRETVVLVVDSQGEGGAGGRPPGRGRRWWSTAKERVVDWQGVGGRLQGAQGSNYRIIKWK